MGLGLSTDYLPLLLVILLLLLLFLLLFVVRATPLEEPTRPSRPHRTAQGPRRAKGWTKVLCRFRLFRGPTDS